MHATHYYDLMIDMFRRGPVRGKPYRWTQELPKRFGALFGQPLSIRFETAYPNTDPIPCEEEVALGLQIVEKMGSFLPLVEDMARENLGMEFGDIVAMVRASHILINRRTLIEEGPTRWALVVKGYDLFDFGRQYDFDGSRLLDQVDRLDYSEELEMVGR